MLSTAALHNLIPAALRDRLGKLSASGLSFSVERYPAVTLIADVAGFTELVERYSAHDPDGVEELSRIINSHFGCMVDVISAHGGDVVRFAGDAPIAVFTPDRVSGGSNKESLREPVVRAVACSLALHRALRHLHALDAAIVTRIGIGAGNVVAVIAGGGDGCWEFVLGGQPLMQMASAQRIAVMGETVLSPDAVAVAGNDLEGDPTVNGGLCVQALRAPLVSFLQRNVHTDLADELVRPFIPRSVTHFLEAGQSAWAAEFRRVSVLFLNILGLDLESSAGPARLNSAFRALQAVVCEDGGSTVQFLNDDKGLTLLSAWGLQGATHEDDAVRVVRCALAARARLTELGLSSRVGIATGRIFCGWRGNQHRREYALMGTTVNRGARLMAASADDVLCDVSTVRAAGVTVRFENAGELRMKGGVQSIATFRPLESRSHRPTLEGVAATRLTPAIIGRQPEKDTLFECLGALARGGGGTVLIRGAAGIGKSALLSEFLAQAAAAGVMTAAGSGVSFRTLEPYLVWRTILSRILELDLNEIETRRAAQIVDRLKRHSGLEEWAPLLAEVLGIAMPDNDLTQRMSEHLRAEKIRDLVVSLLNEAATAAPLAIVLDNAHWLDSLSLGLVRAASRRVARILIVLTTRPTEQDTAPDLLEILGSPSTRTIDLGPLNRQEVRSLICQRLRVTHVPDVLTAMVEGKSSGYPLFVGELASSLLESGVIRTTGSACVLVDGENELHSQHVPESVQGAIAARLDRLNAEEQLTLKVASVLGSEFDVRTLAAVHPLRASPTQLGGTLQTLEARGLIKSTAERQYMCEFGHAVIQDVAYTTLPSEQRRSLHHAVAEWYERNPGIASPPALLAHHWACAEDRSKSLDWLERAGIDAARKGAIAETLGHFRRALDISDRSDVAQVDTLRRIRWLRYVGFATAELGDVHDGVLQLQTALHLLGKRLPRSRIWLNLRLGREVLIQTGLLAHVLRTRARISPTKREMFLEQAEIYRLLGKAAFFEQDHLTYVTASLVAINLAERTGAHDTAASAYAALAYLVAMLGLRRLAERWWKMADESSQPEAKLDVVMGRMMFLNSHARWEESAGLVKAQATMIERIGNSTSMPLHQIIQFYLNLHRGELDAARVNATAYLDWALSQNNVQEGLSGHVHLIILDLLQGRAADATRRIMDAEALASRVATPMYRIMYLGLRVDARRDAGNLDAAAHDAEMLQQLLDQTPSYIGGEMSGYVALTEYFIARWRQAGQAAAAKVARSHALKAYRTLKKHALLNPYARPRRWLLDAKIATTEERFDRARRSRQRALRLAERYQMSRESADAHLELGLDATLPASTRARHLSAARDIFAKMGCAIQVQRIDESFSHLGVATA
jgi:class 3 adenylate cyclase/tetratricopeptide (TPR) repeat protein